MSFADRQCARQAVDDVTCRKLGTAEDWAGFCLINPTGYEIAVFRALIRLVTGIAGIVAERCLAQHQWRIVIIIEISVRCRLRRLGQAYTWIGVRWSPSVSGASDRKSFLYASKTAVSSSCGNK